MSAAEMSYIVHALAFVRCETKNVVFLNSGVNIKNEDFFPIQIYSNILTIVKGSC